MHADMFWTPPPPDSAPLIQTKEIPAVDISNINVLLVFSVGIQFCSLLVLYLMIDKVSGLLNAYMIVHYEKIAKWKHGGITAADRAATARRPVAVQPLG